MLALDEKHAVRDRGCLIPSQRRTRIGKAAEIGEREVRRAVVDGIARGPGDPQFGRDVGLVRKKRYCLAAIPAEIPTQVVDPLRSERVTPPEIRVVPESGGLVPKTVKLCLTPVAALHSEIEREPVLFRYGAAEAETQTICVLRDGG